MRVTTRCPGILVRKIGLTDDHEWQQRGRVPTDPLPDWVPARRRAIGLRIAATRQDRGLAIDDIAESTGLDRKTVMTAELGRNAPTLDTLLLVAQALAVPLAELVADDPAAADTGAAGRSGE
jgi:DNA-binding XRE family transcriptional regulator